MPKLRYAFSFLLIVAASALKAEAAPPASACAEGVQVALAEQMQKIKTYSLKTKVNTPHGIATAYIEGSAPNLLKITMTEGTQPHTYFTTVFDGDFQWLETRTEEEVSVLKVALQEVTSKERPFDTSLTLHGSGLLSGESFPSTITTLLTIYELEEKCTDSTISLSGRIATDRFLQYASSHLQHSQAAEISERFIKRFGSIEIIIDSETRLPTFLRMGPSIEDKEQLQVNFLDLQIDADLAEEAFEYKLPPNITPVDMTQEILARRKR